LPDTFVDVDHNLNTAINKIREVLGDSAEKPALCRNSSSPWISFHRTCGGQRSCHAACPPATRHESGFRYWASRSTILVVAIVLLAATGILIYKRLHNSAPAAQQRLLTRLTFDEGLQVGATWSPDSRFIAYSSNRGGKFDIWVQQVSGGDPVQITREQARTGSRIGRPMVNTLRTVPKAGDGGLLLCLHLAARV